MKLFLPDFGAAIDCTDLVDDTYMIQGTLYEHCQFFRRGGMVSCYFLLGGFCLYTRKMMYSYISLALVQVAAEES